MSFSLSQYTEIFAPDPTGGAYSAPPDPLAGFKGPLRGMRVMEGRGGKNKEEGERGRERGTGKERKRVEIGGGNSALVVGG